MIKDRFPVGILMDALLIQWTLNVALDVHTTARRTRARYKMWSAKCFVTSGAGNVIELDSVVRNGIDHGRLEEDPKAIVLCTKFVHRPTLGATLRKADGWIHVALFDVLSVSKQRLLRTSLGDFSQEGTSRPLNRQVIPVGALAAVSAMNQLKVGIVQLLQRIKAANFTIFIRLAPATHGSSLIIDGVQHFKGTVQVGAHHVLLLRSTAIDNGKVEKERRDAIPQKELDAINRSPRQIVLLQGVNVRHTIVVIEIVVFTNVTASTRAAAETTSIRLP